MYVIADKPNSSYIGLACKNQEWMNKGYKTQDFHLNIKKTLFKCLKWLYDILKNKNNINFIYDGCMCSWQCI